MDPVRVMDFGTERGRSLVSTRPIKVDEVIFTERPLVCCQFSWSRYYGYAACDYCLHPLESAEENARRLLADQSFCLPFVEGVDPPLPVKITSCPSCSLAYCSEACQAASANTYHTFICPAACLKSATGEEDNVFDKLDTEWRNSQFPPETGTVMLLVRIAAIHFNAYFKKDLRSTHIVNALTHFVSELSFNTTASISAAGDSISESSAVSTTTLTHKMLGPHFQGSLGQLYARFVDVLVEMARRVGFVTEGSLPEALKATGLQAMLSEYGFCSAMCLIGRNGQGIGTSALGQWGKAAEAAVKEKGGETEAKLNKFLDSLYDRLDDTVGEFLDNEGVGLYEKQSLINHSCEPNTQVRFKAGTDELEIVAKTDVQVDTEITICYFDECILERGQHTRRKYLAEHYLFICQCPRCIREKTEHPLAEQSATSSEEEEDDDDDDADEPME